MGKMWTGIIDNSRDKDGEFPSKLCCSECGTQSEAYKEYTIGKEQKIYLCKSCLTKSIEGIDNTILSKVKHIFKIKRR